MRIFVTDGENRAALAVTRSLGRAGHEVLVGEKHSPSLAHVSRYCARRVVYPDPVTASDAFVESLARVVRAERIDVLIPVADITTFLVTRHRDRFPASCAVPFADADVLARAANKVEIVQTAMRLGVPVPRTVIVCDPGRIPEHDLGYPVVIKPRQSRVQTPTGWVSSGVSYAVDSAQLARDLAVRPRHEFPLMLQERIVGPGMGVFACYEKGRPVALFSHRRLRERPPWGGVSVLSESAPLCPKARDYATRLLDELGWHGVAMVEFKRDLRDGEPKVMEINGRFWGSLQLAIDAGVDFPGLLVQSAVSGRFEPQAPYRLGVRSRWLWGDLDSLLLSLFSKNGPPGAAAVSRARAILNFATFWGKDLRYDNPRPDDVRPWLLETSRRFQTAASSVVRRSTPAPRPAPASPALSVSVSSLDRTGVDDRGWNELAAGSDTHSVFQTHEWTRAWWNTYGEQFEPLFITAADHAGVAGIAPLVLEQRASGQCAVKFAGDGRSDYCDFLIARDQPEVLRSIFEALSRDQRWHAIELNNIPSHSRTVGLIHELAARMGYRSLADDLYPCPTLLIEGHEDDARRIVDKPSLRRRTNYFQRNGRLVCRNLTTAAEIEPYLNAFFDQHVARWGGSASSSLFLDPRNRAFYRELTRQIAPRGWLLFSVVEFNGRPIAFHYGFDYNGSVIWYKPTFDPEFEQHSPGIVMVRHLIGYAIEQKRRELDFTVGDEPFKRRFTNSTRRTVGMYLFRDPAAYYWARSKRELRVRMRKLAR
jgi:predicted ATP-grasp superfamily ATP-dependent carboligase/CelD/BcsL family acetyltransferase involved in cellulose biosynthesis